MKEHLKLIGFEFELASNLSPKKLKTLLKEKVGWQNLSHNVDPSIDYEVEGMRYAVEIQTKPEPMMQGLRRLKRALKLFQEIEVATNYTTGMHVNLSFAKSGYNYDIQADKLHTLTDDLYWLQRFDRLDNHFCYSGKFEIAKYIKRAGSKFKVDNAVDWLEEKCDKVNVDENDLNIKENAINITKLTNDPSPYVEFRIIGGADYHWRFPEINRAIRHFSQSMDRSLGHRFNYLHKRYLSRMAAPKPKPVAIIPH